MICSTCGLDYADFRTDTTYANVWQQFWSGNDDPNTWRNKRRNTVLGRWHELKMMLWNEHVRQCEEQAAYEKVPF